MKKIYFILLVAVALVSCSKENIEREENYISLNGVKFDLDKAQHKTNYKSEYVEESGYINVFLTAEHISSEGSNVSDSNGDISIMGIIGGYGTVTDIREIGQFIASVDNIGVYFANGNGETYIRKNQMGDSDEGIKFDINNDSIDNGWVVVEEISAHKARIRGKFTTQNGVVGEFNFSFFH